MAPSASIKSRSEHSGRILTETHRRQPPERYGDLVPAPTQIRGGKVFVQWSDRWTVNDGKGVSSNRRRKLYKAGKTPSKAGKTLAKTNLTSSPPFALPAPPESPPPPRRKRGRPPKAGSSLESNAIEFVAAKKTAPAKSELITPVVPAQMTTENVAWTIEVGDSIAHYWDGDTAWYRGKVTQYAPHRKKPYFVEYNDGDQLWIDAAKERIKIVGSKKAKLNRLASKSASVPKRQKRGAEKTSESTVGLESEIMETDAEDGVNSVNSTSESSERKGPMSRSSSQFAHGRQASPIKPLSGGKRGRPPKNNDPPASPSKAAGSRVKSGRGKPEITALLGPKGRAELEVGYQISHYWDGDELWYTGVVRQYVPHRKRPFHVEYTDGDKLWLDPCHERIKVLRRPSASVVQTNATSLTKSTAKKGRKIESVLAGATAAKQELAFDDRRMNSDASKVRNAVAPSSISKTSSVCYPEGEGVAQSSILALTKNDADESPKVRQKRGRPPKVKSMGPTEQWQNASGNEASHATKKEPASADVDLSEASPLTRKRGRPPKIKHDTDVPASESISNAAAPAKKPITVETPNNGAGHASLSDRAKKKRRAAKATEKRNRNHPSDSVVSDTTTDAVFVERRATGGDAVAPTPSMAPTRKRGRPRKHPIVVESDSASVASARKPNVLSPESGENSAEEALGTQISRVSDEAAVDPEGRLTVSRHGSASTPQEAVAEHRGVMDDSVIVTDVCAALDQSASNADAEDTASGLETVERANLFPLAKSSQFDSEILSIDDTQAEKKELNLEERCFATNTTNTEAPTPILTANLLADSQDPDRIATYSTFDVAGSASSLDSQAPMQRDERRGPCNPPLVMGTPSLETSRSNTPIKQIGIAEVSSEPNSTPREESLPNDSLAGSEKPWLGQSKIVSLHVGVEIENEIVSRLTRENDVATLPYCTTIRRVVKGSNSKKGHAAPSGTSYPTNDSSDEESVYPPPKSALESLVTVLYPEAQVKKADKGDYESSVDESFEAGGGESDTEKSSSSAKKGRTRPRDIDGLHPNVKCRVPRDLLSLWQKLARLWPDDLLHMLPCPTLLAKADEHYRHSFPVSSPVRLLVLSESPAATDDALKDCRYDSVIANLHRIDDGPMDHINLVHCLSYGEPWLLEGYERFDRREVKQMAPGTPPFWKVLGTLAGLADTHCEPSEAMEGEQSDLLGLLAAAASTHFDPLSDVSFLSKAFSPVVGGGLGSRQQRLHNKIEVLRELKRRGIVVMDACPLPLHFCGGRGRKAGASNVPESPQDHKIPTACYKKIMKLCWLEYVLPILNDVQPQRVLIMGKKLQKALHALAVPTLGNCLLPPLPHPCDVTLGSGVNYLQHFRQLRDYASQCVQEVSSDSGNVSRGPPIPHSRYDRYSDLAPETAVRYAYFTTSPLYKEEVSRASRVDCTSARVVSEETTC